MLDLRQMETNPLSRFDSTDSQGNWYFGSRYNLAGGRNGAMGERVFSMEALNNPHQNMRRSTNRLNDLDQPAPSQGSFFNQRHGGGGAYAPPRNTQLGGGYYGLQQQQFGGEEDRSHRALVKKWRSQDSGLGSFGSK